MAVLSTFAVLTSLSLSTPTGSGVDDVAPNDPVLRAVTIDSASSEWTRRVEWGLDRFRIAGLPLPAISVTVHDDDAPCDGNSGLYLPNDPVEIHLCAHGPADSRPARNTVLHELGHAWAESQLSAAERTAFLELRGLEVWYDPRVPKHARGMEHAAEVVAWGLMDEMIPIIRIYNAEPADLSTAFNLLAKRSPLWTRAPAVRSENAQASWAPMRWTSSRLPGTESQGNPIGVFPGLALEPRDDVQVKGEHALPGFAAAAVQEVHTIRPEPVPWPFWRPLARDGRTRRGLRP